MIPLEQMPGFLALVLQGSSRLLTELDRQRDQDELFSRELAKPRIIRYDPEYDETVVHSRDQDRSCEASLSHAR